MASDKDKSSDDGQVPSTETKSQAVTNDELDLDKNPIKYATHEPGKFDMDPHDKPYLEMVIRSGQHSEIAKKLLRQRIEQRAMEFPRWPGDVGSGVRVMWVESRFWYDRERLSQDFDQDWREYRAKYIHSLALHPNEPVYVPEYERFLINPIRRFYMKGGNWLENNIILKYITRDKLKSAYYRVNTTRTIMAYFLLVAGYYYVRYNHRKWDYRSGPEIQISCPKYYPDHPKYPFEDFRTEPGHFWDRGFSRRNIYKDLRDYEDTTAVL